VEFDGLATDPWGNAKAGFTAGAELEREDWGVSWNAPLDAGGFLVSKTVILEIEAQLARPS
jgi:polyisoprenoid-binding protein YceI